MGKEIVNAICRESELQLVGAVELEVSEDYLILPDNSGTVSFSSNLDYILTSCKPDVLVDFTTQKAIMPAVRAATERGIHLVIGTTGLSDDEFSEIGQLAQAHQVGAIAAPNFALGAILMIHLAKVAAKYMDYAEIIELHHNMKIDAPSGTALATARAMAQARGKPFSRPSEQGKNLNSRGEQVDGVPIHSVRLPGLLAHQEVILGGPGQTLSIRHDTINRECFMPGIMLAIKGVIKLKGLVYGLDTVLGL